MTALESTMATSTATREGPYYTHDPKWTGSGQAYTFYYQQASDASNRTQQQTTTLAPLPRPWSLGDPMQPYADTPTGQSGIQQTSTSDERPAYTSPSHDQLIYLPLPIECLPHHSPNPPHHERFPSPFPAWQQALPTSPASSFPIALPPLTSSNRGPVSRETTPGSRPRRSRRSIDLSDPAIQSYMAARAGFLAQATETNLRNERARSEFAHIQRQQHRQQRSRSGSLSTYSLASSSAKQQQHRRQREGSARPTFAQRQESLQREMYAKVERSMRAAQQKKRARQAALVEEKDERCSGRGGI